MLNPLQFPISFIFDFIIKVRLSLHSSQVAHQAGAYPGFCSMKQLGVFLLPPGWDASPSQATAPPTFLNMQYSSIVMLPVVCL